MSKNKKTAGMDDSNDQNINNDKSHDAFDGLFKKFMSDPNNAKDFFSLFLVENIWQLVDKSTMMLCPQTFVDNKLKHKHVDVLYRTKFESHPGYIYLLTEEQTEPDETMPFRIMQYVMRIIEMHQRQFDTLVFPIVYPLIFYVGKKNYPYSTDFFDGFGDQKDLAKCILTNPFPVANVVGVSDEALKAHPLAGTLSKVYQLANVRDLVVKLQRLGPQFLYIDTHAGSDLVLSMLKFILDKTKHGDAKAVIQTVQEMVTPKTESEIMTLSQQLIDKGVQQGMQQGMQTGMQHEKYSIAKKLLLKGLDDNFILETTELNLDEFTKLKLEMGLARH